MSELSKDLVNAAINATDFAVEAGVPTSRAVVVAVLRRLATTTPPAVTYWSGKKLAEIADEIERGA